MGGTVGADVLVATAVEVGTGVAVKVGGGVFVGASVGVGGGPLRLAACESRVTDELLALWPW
ncbi:MAG TPA: hypothetical protein VHS28_03335 [Chloroflexota bacterium]|nr:hypothetical protein [Chloroflexota bacterium]